MFSALLVTLLGSPVPLVQVADVDDAYATMVNPGGLGLLEGAELRLIYARTRVGAVNDLALSGAVRLGPLGLGAGLAWDDLSGTSELRPSFGLGLGSESFGVGASWQRVDDDVGRWAAGATWRPARALSIGVASTDLGEILGPRPYELGVASRIFDDRLLLSVRWRLIHGQPIEHDEGRPDLRVLLGIEPIDGVTLTASADLHFRASIQLGFDLGGFGLGGGVTRLDAAGPSTVFGEIALSAPARPSAFVPSRVVVLELEGDVTPEGRFNLFAGGFDEPIFGGALRLLEAMREHQDVRGALLKIGPLSLGWARLEELHRAVSDVRRAGRRVDCVLSAAGDAEIYLASACDQVAVLAPIPVNVDGVAASFVYLREALDELGIEPRVARRGAYKSAPDMFMESAMSREEREVADALLDRAYATLEGGIVEGRKLTKPELAEILALGTLTATEAKARRLVDEVLYPDEIEGWARGRHEEQVSFIEAAKLPVDERARWGARPRIALITIDAPITAGESSEMPLGLGVESGAETIIGALEAARADPNVRAVVLRVESPGGDAIASALIARAVKKLNEVKPVIASFGDVAASGGYYVAAPAKLIYASPGTITGSIGIFSLQFSIERLLARARRARGPDARRARGRARRARAGDRGPLPAVLERGRRRPSQEPR